jgi:hypothetical protein
MAASFITFFHILLVLFCIIVYYGFTFCMLLFNFVTYVFLLLFYVLFYFTNPYCYVFRSGYSVSLCFSVYCLCVNV